MSKSTEKTLSLGAGGESGGSLVEGQTSQGVEIHANLLRMTRFTAAFEMYESANVLRTSEVLSDFRIVTHGKIVYSGRAVVGKLIDTGSVTVCEATLEDCWLDISFFPPEGWKNRLRDDFSEFLASSQRAFAVLPEFKVAIADLQVLLMDLRGWLEQVELGVRSQPSGDRVQIEREAILAVREPIVQTALQVLEHFESVAGTVDPEVRDAHMSYMKRQIHPLVLCSPFIHRTYFKPLGYAGDYEMVNMMVRDPFEGASLFAKVINNIFLTTPPVVAHRDRLTYLTRLLTEETQRTLRRKTSVKIFNLGCGPAKEVQDFLATEEMARHTEFTLLDFNDETLAYTTRTLAGINLRREHQAKIQLIKKSVNQLIKEAMKIQNSPVRYDFVYCAGLFDYLSDPVCRNLVGLFYELATPGGLVIATNVADPNPSRNWMEYVLDWHLVYRNARQLAALAPAAAPPDAVRVSAVGDGLNIFLEVRKPEHA